MPAVPHTPDDPLRVDSWTDLHSLPGALHALGAGVSGLTDHAREWACRTSPFEPSPVCVLRPLVPVLDRVGEAFTDVGRALAGELAALGDDVSAVLHAIAAADTDASADVAVPTVWGEVA